MTPDPTLEAIREVRHQISASIDRDARKLDALLDKITLENLPDAEDTRIPNTGPFNALVRAVHPERVEGSTRTETPH